MLQRTLITAHISLLRFDKKDAEVFRDVILPPTKVAFMRLRHDIDITIREIGSSLGCGPMVVEATQSGYLEYLDRERTAAAAGTVQPVRRSLSLKSMSSMTTRDNKKSPTNEEVAENIFDVSKRLQHELGIETPGGVDSTRPSTPTHHDATPRMMTPEMTPESTVYKKGSRWSKPRPIGVVASHDRPPKKKYGPTRIKGHFGEFEAAQKNIFVDILTSSDLGYETQLKVHEAGPSITELYGGDYLRGDVEEGDLLASVLRHDKPPKTPISNPNTPPSAERKVKAGKKAQPETHSEQQDDRSEESDHNDDSSIHGPTPEFKRNETLVRVYSLLFAWE